MINILGVINKMKNQNIKLVKQNIVKDFRPLVVSSIAFGPGGLVAVGLNKHLLEDEVVLSQIQVFKTTEEQNWLDPKATYSLGAGSEVRNIEFFKGKIIATIGGPDCAAVSIFSFDNNSISEISTKKIESGGPRVKVEGESIFATSYLGSKIQKFFYDTSDKALKQTGKSVNVGYGYWLSLEKTGSQELFLVGEGGVSLINSNTSKVIRTAKLIIHKSFQGLKHIKGAVILFYNDQVCQLFKLNNGDSFDVSKKYSLDACSDPFSLVKNVFSADEVNSKSVLLNTYADKIYKLKLESAKKMISSDTLESNYSVWELSFEGVKPQNVDYKIIYNQAQKKAFAVFDYKVYELPLGLDQKQQEIAQLLPNQQQQQIIDYHQQQDELGKDPQYQYPE